ncbi:MAG: hypothetical protein ABIG64_09710 [Candidatus Omnitrophota bacterium]
MKLVSKKNILFLLGITVLLGLFFLIFKLPIITYNLLVQKELVAVVECRESKVSKLPKSPNLPKEPKNQKTKFLQVCFFPQRDYQKEENYPFDADEWVIEGRLIKYKIWPKILGIKTYYKLERISSRYFDINQEKNKPRIVYDLSGGRDNFWFFIYKYQHCLPFIEAVYGNSAFVPFSAGKKFNVYITDSGFMIQENTNRENLI